MTLRNYFTYVSKKQTRKDFLYIYTFFSAFSSKKMDLKLSRHEGAELVVIVADKTTEQEFKRSFRNQSRNSRNYWSNKQRECKGVRERGGADGGREGQRDRDSKRGGR